MNLYTLPDSTIINLDYITAVGKLRITNIRDNTQEYTVYLVDGNYTINEKIISRHSFVSYIKGIK